MTETINNAKIFESDTPSLSEILEWAAAAGMGSYIEAGNGLRKTWFGPNAAPIVALAKMAFEAGCKKQAEEVSALRSVCAEAYQMAGAYDAPTEALDNLSAAANGDRIPHKTFLPILATEEA